MPLDRGCSTKAMSANISNMVSKEGKSQDQAVAIGYSVLRKSCGMTGGDADGMTPKEIVRAGKAKQGEGKVMVQFGDPLMEGKAKLGKIGGFWGQYLKGEDRNAARLMGTIVRSINRMDVLKYTRGNVEIVDWDSDERGGLVRVFLSVDVPRGGVDDLVQSGELDDRTDPGPRVPYRAVTIRTAHGWETVSAREEVDDPRYEEAGPWLEDTLTKDMSEFKKPLYADDPTVEGGRRGGKVAFRLGWTLSFKPSDFKMKGPWEYEESDKSTTVRFGSELLEREQL